MSINSWMTTCGGPVPAAVGYLLVMIMMVPIGLCYAELVPMLPVAGGGMAFAFKAFNGKVAIISSWASLGGMIAIVAQAAYFLAGFETIPQGVEDAGGDIKTVGRTVVLSVTLTCILYAFLLFSFGYAWPCQQFADSSIMVRPATATMFRYLYPGAGGNVLYWILTIGAIAGLFTTWNGFFTAFANLL